MIKNIFFSGRPGCGKTTLIKQIISCLRFKAGGFYTEEIREEGSRVGFKIFSLDGRQGILAHVKFKGKPMVGKYGVNIDALEDIGVNSIINALKENKIIIIDEVGKMELFSVKFKEAVLDALNSDNFVLGTIKSAPCEFTEEIRKRKDVKVIELQRDNGIIKEEILKEINAFYS